MDDLEIILHEVTQVQNDDYHVLSHMWTLASNVFMCVYVGVEV